MRSLVTRRQRASFAPKYQVDLKRWDPRFFRNRLSCEISYLHTWRQHDTAGEILEIFLHDYECPIPSYMTEVVFRFCQQPVSNFTPHAVNPARAWVHDRESGTGAVRERPLWLTADSLRTLLKEPRFGLEEKPNADRRLIYISRLDREFFLALAETVSQNQVVALKDTVWKHLAFESSIKVHIPLFGYTSFRLEFHVPYLMLRVSDGAQQPESWANLSFLNMEPNAKGQDQYTVKRAHTSIVICGSDHFRWVGYAFANPGFSELDESASEMKSDEDDDDTKPGGNVDDIVDGDSHSVQEIEVDEPCEPKIDYMMSDGQGRVVQVDHQPIHDPRRYFLCILEQRVVMVYKEWDYLVHKIEKSVQVRDDNSRAVLSVSPTDIDQDNVKQLLDWNVSTQRLLSQLTADLSRFLRSWEDFSGPGGDIGYFSDITQMKTRMRMNGIRESFTRMANLERKLFALDNGCDRSINILARCMEAESNRLNLASHQLNYETNLLSRDMHQLNRQNTELVKETTVLSRDMHRLNLQSTNLAKESSRLSRDMYLLNQESTEFAKDTSRITRVNVQLLWVTTPFVLVLQYFGSENDIFAFERNTRTFGISICVVLLALPLLTYILNVLNDMGKMAVAFVSTRLGRNIPLKAAAIESHAVQEPIDVDTTTSLRTSEATRIELRSLSA